MKISFVILSLILFFSITASGQIEKYSRIRIQIPHKTALDKVWQAGIDFEGSSGKVGGWMEFVAGTADLRRLTSSGVPYQVVVDDLTAEYLRQQSPLPAQPAGFGFGSMGGFYTNDEVARQLDTMAILYPSLVTLKSPIGFTNEGRTIWAIEISSNPGTPQPEALYTALHHAREPEGMMSLIYYMWWLLQNYGTDAEATYLVNNRHLWFIPVVNPDGYVYNQTISPAGGGMWRKNRRDNGDGTYGIDLNRNYGTFEMWNAANGGSSSSPGSDTYRGPSPFSEPETDAINNFVRIHNFKSCLNYHTYGNYLIYPWGYLSRENRDSLIYRDWTYEMISVNHFTNGTDQQTVAYSTRGNSDDFLFGDTTKPVTYAMTPEVGTSGFWPSTGEILPLAISTLAQNKLIAHVAGHYATVVASSLVDGGNGFLTRGSSFTLHLSVKNRGLDTAANLTVAISAASPYVHLASSSVLLSTLTAQSTADLSFNGTVAGNAIVGTPFQLFVTITDPAGYWKDDTLALFLGAPTALFSDSATGGAGKWSTGQGWGTTSNAHTPPLAFTDSPSGVYLPNADNSLTMLTPVDLTGYQFVELRFWTKWALEPTWDFATVELSTNNGVTWLTLRSNLSHSGSNRDAQQSAEKWGYESYTPGLTWVEQQIDLSSYVNQQVTLRFRVASDGREQRDGFYVDDVRLFGYITDADTIPPLTAPTLTLPVNGALHRPTTLDFRWNGMPGADGYRLQIAFDSLFAVPVFDDSTIVDTNRSIGSLLNDTNYFWRLRAKNVKGPGPWSSPTFRFSTGLASTILAVSHGWNLISLPLTVADGRVSTLFPTLLDGAFYYRAASGYLFSDSLLFGGGYWARFGSAQSIPVTGNPQELGSLPVDVGWNLIGSVSQPVPVSSISSLPPAIQTGNFFGYLGGGYSVVDTLFPGQAYWVKISQSGLLTLGSGNSTASGSIRIVAIRDRPPLPPGLPASEKNVLPTAYRLAQNYPNPFNPSTKISYALPEQTFVTLKVYNVLGEVVAILVNEEQMPGYKSVIWDAAGISSGVYFMRMNAGTFTTTRKLMLIK